MPDGETMNAGPPPRWVPAFVGISAVIGPLLWYFTGSLAATAVSLLYFMWWAWTVPNHYHAKTDVEKTDEWASKLSRAHIIAVPGLAIVILLGCAVLLWLLGYVLHSIGTTVSWYSGDTVATLIPFALALPVVTAAILWHVTIMFSRMIKSK